MPSGSGRFSKVRFGSEVGVGVTVGGTLEGVGEGDRVWEAVAVISSSGFCVGDSISCAATVMAITVGTYCVGYRVGTGVAAVLLQPDRMMKAKIGSDTFNNDILVVVLVWDQEINRQYIVQSHPAKSVNGSVWPGTLLRQPPVPPGWHQFLDWQRA